MTIRARQTRGDNLGHPEKRDVQMISDRRALPINDWAHCVSKEDWSKIKSALPKSVYTRSADDAGILSFVDAVVWVVGGNRFWSELPTAEYGPWRRHYMRSNRWSRYGIWMKVVRALGPDHWATQLIVEHLLSNLLAFGRHEAKKQSRGRPDRFAGDGTAHREREVRECPAPD